MRRLVFCTICLSLLLGITPALATPYDDSINQIRQQWAVVKYETSDHDEQEEAVFTLKHQALDLSKAYPNKAEPLIWLGIIDETKAAIDSNFGSLLLIQQARDLFIQAYKIDPKALHGLGVGNLGYLYAKAPKPPLSFGNMDLAKEYLEKAMQLSPSGLDSNYFYGSYLHLIGDDAKAKTVLTHALAAPAQANNEVADKGRRQEIQEMLDDLDTD